MLKASEFRYYNIGLCPIKYTRYAHNAGFRGIRRTLFYTQTEHTYYLPKVVLSTPKVTSTSHGFLYNKPWPGDIKFVGLDLGKEVTAEEDEAWAALLAYCTKPPVDVAEQVINDMQSRRKFGIKKYGRPVTPHNGRHALKDAYEEVLDLAVYLKQQLLEDGQSGVHVPGDVGRTA